MRREILLTTESFMEEDLYKAEQVRPLNIQIEEQCDRMKSNHIERLQREECTLQQGFVFNDIVTVCERISNHCSHIASAILEN